MNRAHRPLLLTGAVAACLLLVGVSSAYAGQVFVHTPANGTVVLDVQPSETIAQVEADIQTRIGVDPSVQILTFANHVLDPIQNLSYYNITINESYLPAGSWSQSAHSITFVAPATSAGNYRIQLFNGSAPVLASQSLVITPAPIVPSAAHKKITYLHCLNSWHLRIAFGVNPSCPVGYINK